MKTQTTRDEVKECTQRQPKNLSEALLNSFLPGALVTSAVLLLGGVLLPRSWVGVGAKIVEVRDAALATITGGHPEGTGPCAPLPGAVSCELSANINACVGGVHACTACFGGGTLPTFCQGTSSGACIDGTANCSVQHDEQGVCVHAGEVVGVMCVTTSEGVTTTPCSTVASCH